MKTRNQWNRTSRGRGYVTVCTVLALLALYPATGLADLPALPSTGVLMDCGSLWIDGADTRVRLQASRGLYRQRS